MMPYDQVDHNFSWTKPGHQIFTLSLCIGAEIWNDNVQNVTNKYFLNFLFENA